MSMRDIADVCDIKDLKYFRESYIAPALEEGLIERLYPNQPKHPKQQYRLTETAKEWLTDNTKQDCQLLVSGKILKPYLTFCFPRTADMLNVQELHWEIKTIRRA